MSDNTPSAYSNCEVGLPQQSDDHGISLLKSASNMLVPGNADTLPLHVHLEVDSKEDVIVRKKMSRLLQGREDEWTAVASRTGPLQLLNLPMDILKEIVKEVTHTNDLTALALTHSALHNLAIPFIYSRFDIVWPDVTSTNDSRSGVDALTYGLATLVMGKDNFPAVMRRRIGNNYPQYTRKFSLGNGPAEWVNEYAITKESGKMLGTLVALAVARMITLEQFVWDMPTGVLRDVWLALSSLEDRSPPGECRLEKVLVRWHDNSLESSSAPTSPPIPPGADVSPIGIVIDPTAPSSPQAATTSPSFHVDTNRNRVEYPTFSVLPPIKSLSVLDIDELSYLDEMSIAIEKSKDCIRELRVGIAKKAQWRDWVMAWDGPGLQQAEYTSHSLGVSTPNGEKRLGGVLGVLLGRVYDIRRRPAKVLYESKSPIPKDPPTVVSDVTPVGATSDVKDPTIEEVDAAVFVPSPTYGPEPEGIATSNTALSSSLPDLADSLAGVALAPPKKIPLPSRQNPVEVVYPKLKRSNTRIKQEKETRSNMLKLQVLELERVPLSVIVLQKGLDWSVLTSLTLLDCSYHEKLWRMLRRQFQPKVQGNGLGLTGSAQPLEYPLCLKKIHTDHVTPSLISFLKETLAPNSLEVLFLQDRKRGGLSPPVTIEQIYKGAIRRHRKSLRKLLIDSADRIPKHPGTSSDNARWRTWMVSHDFITFLTSGSMCSLRELSVSMSYKDWHYFLRRLPQVPTLRSLNIPFVADHVTAAYDPKELAMQIVDMIFMRPEIELCYLGIANKCFEILENRHDDVIHDGHDGHGQEAVNTSDEEENEEGESSDDDADADDDEDEDEETETATEAVEAEGNGLDHSEHEESDSESTTSSVDERSKLSLRLREILYYDDKVAIFRARHRRL